MKATLEKEVDLLECARNGDRAAFEAIVESYRLRVFGTLFNLLGAYQEAEEVFWDVWAEVWRSLPRFKGESSFSTSRQKAQLTRTRQAARSTSISGAHQRLSGGHTALRSSQPSNRTAHTGSPASRPQRNLGPANFRAPLPRAPSPHTQGFRGNGPGNPQMGRAPSFSPHVGGGSHGGRPTVRSGGAPGPNGSTGGGGHTDKHHG